MHINNQKLSFDIIYGRNIFMEQDLLSNDFCHISKMFILIHTMAIATNIPVLLMTDFIHI